MKIEFTCSEETIVKWFPPLPAKKVIPEWYKNLDLYLPGTKNALANIDARVRCLDMGNHSPFTVKACIPILDYLTSGYVLRMPADVLLTPDEKNDFYWFTQNDYAVKIGNHVYGQCPVEIDGEKKNYFKIEQPWLIKTPPGYSCLFYQPFYEMEDRYTLLPAIVDTDKYDMPVFFPGFFKTKQPFKLNAGDPFVVVMPFKRDDWTMEVSTKPKSVSVINYLFERAYKTFFHSSKKFN